MNEKQFDLHTYPTHADHAVVALRRDKNLLSLNVLKA